MNDCRSLFLHCCVKRCRVEFCSMKLRKTDPKNADRLLLRYGKHKLSSKWKSMEPSCSGPALSLWTCSGLHRRLWRPGGHHKRNIQGHGTSLQTAIWDPIPVCPLWCIAAGPCFSLGRNEGFCARISHSFQTNFELVGTLAWNESWMSFWLGFILRSLRGGIVRQGKIQESPGRDTSWHAVRHESS